MIRELQVRTTATSTPIPLITPDTGMPLFTTAKDIFAAIFPLPAVQTTALVPQRKSLSPTPTTGKPLVETVMITSSPDVKAKQALSTRVTLAPSIVDLETPTINIQLASLLSATRVDGDLTAKRQVKRIMTVPSTKTLPSISQMTGVGTRAISQIRHIRETKPTTDTSAATRQLTVAPLLRYPHLRYPHQSVMRSAVDWCFLVASCLHPASNIFANPQKTMIAKVGKNQKVLTPEGVYQKIKQVAKRKFSGQMIRLATAKIGSSLVTNNHPVLTFSPRQLKWKRAKDIDKKDLLVFPIKALLDNGLASLISSFKRLADDCLLFPLTRIDRFSYQGWVYNLNIEDSPNYTTANAIVSSYCIL